MNMLERAERALKDAFGGKEFMPYGEGVRAVLAAIRDEDHVTDEMLEAGRVALHAPENRHGAVLGAVFCAMIDAILEGEKNAD